MPVRLPLLLVSCLFLLPGFDRDNCAVQAQNPKVISRPEVAAQDPEFQVQGEYAQDRKAIQVIALGNDNFRAVIYNGGLPGAGWDKSPPQQVEGNADDMADLTEAYTKVERKSPTLGAKPPEGSIVLFDGTTETFEREWKPGARLTGEDESPVRLLTEGATTTRAFDDYILHLEFLLPFMPSARGQGRANSGAYHQARYETQILDSFGLEGKDNECGGLYRIKAPDVNMCLPPLVWQTYDVDITSARFDAAGKKTQNARITARLNGVVIHNNIELPGTTAGNQKPEGPEPGPLFLQNHGNPVRFRNIWILPRDGEAHSRRPIVPAFERFHASAAAERIPLGQVLLGELNCAGCHAAGAWGKVLTSKQGPRLDQVGQRIHPLYLRQYLLDTHGQKPGTTMPQLLAGKTAAEREQLLEPVVHFLASTGTIADQIIDRQSVSRGDKLFHSVGCTICHAPQSGPAAQAASSVPLGPLHQKYSLTALKEFLKNPHAVRPAGRMPSLHLDDKEATDISHYLLREAKPKLSDPNVNYALYHGRWSEIPDFSQLQPVRTGQTAAFNLTDSGRDDHFGFVFEGWITVPATGDFRFYLGSDDGSRLLVNGATVVDNNGIHPHSVKTGSVRLEAGAHSVRVEYFEATADVSLTVEIEGPKLPRQDLAGLLRLTEIDSPADAPSESPDQFVLRRELIETGREQFANLGCAACHEVKAGGSAVASTVKAPSLDQLNPAGGCLAATVPAGLPEYELSREQRLAIQEALQAGPPKSESADADRVLTTMAAFNCYACHQRDGLGGAEIVRNELFIARIPEMGDEGRLPPPLDGVGDKLQENWLKHVLKNGAQDRPYMHARMPKFQHPTVEALAAPLIAADQKTAAQQVAVDEPPHRLKAIGQELVSGNALACIKCHTFGAYPATGIQAISLTTMHRRLREDWFQRYLQDPQRYRPGTRMPLSFADGVSAAKEILDGSPALQITAMWAYLQDGEKAGIPAGLLPDPIELVPSERPIIYRNFIDGVSPRGIAVGYPEQVNLAWDAGDMCLKLIWREAFIDAGKHWRGRGQGTQRPLGIHTLSFEQRIPWALSSELNENWPAAPARERGFRFLGYQLDDGGRPRFRYEHAAAAFDELYIPQPRSEQESDLKRVIQVTPRRSGTLCFLVASGRDVAVAADGVVTIDQAISVRVSLDQQPATLLSKEQNGIRYVYCEIPLDAPHEIIQTIHW